MNLQSKIKFSTMKRKKQPKPLLKWDPPAPSTVYIKLKDIPYGIFKARLNQGLVTTELDQLSWRLKQHIYCCGVCVKYINEYCVTRNWKVDPEGICKAFMPKEEFRNLQVRQSFGKEREFTYLAERDRDKIQSPEGGTEKISNSAELYEEGFSLYKQGRLRLALEVFERVILENPEHFGALFHKGAALLQLKRLEDSLEAFEKALLVRPGHAGAWTNKGLLLLKLERFQSALEAFEKSISLNPVQKKARDGKDLTQKYIRRSEAFLAKYEQVLQANPNDYRAWFEKGSLHLKLGEREKALKALEKATAIKSDQPEAWYYRGRLLLELGSGKEALHAFERVTRVKPDYAEAWYEKGNAFQKLENKRGALNAYGIAADLWKKGDQLRKADTALDKIRKMRDR